MIFIVVILFSLLKLQHLIERKNPLITMNKTELDSSVTYPLNQDDFMMAFFAENYQTGEAISDPKYVKWVARHIQLKDGVTTKTFHPMHVCNSEDFDKFKPASSKAKEEKV